MPVRKLIDDLPSQENSLQNFYDKYEVKYSTTLTRPPVCMEVIQGTSRIPLFTYGNFSTIIGKAKGRKSFFSVLLLAAFLRGSYQCLSGHKKPGKSKVILFDTEMGNYHVNLSVNRIVHMMELTEHPEDLRVFELRPFAPSERIDHIKRILYDNKDCALAIIDGIRDLVDDINSPEQATSTASLLLKLTEDLDIHILNVIHQNKGDNNARGHLGSELINKSETVFSVNLDDTNKAVSIVTPEYFRGMEFEPLAFEITNQDVSDVSFQLPSIIENYISTKPGKESKITNPAELPTQAHETVLKEVFTEHEKYTYSLLWPQLKLSWKNWGNPIGDNVAKAFITWYQDSEMIERKIIDKKNYYVSNLPPF